MVRGIFWILDNGAKWNDLPAEFGPKSTVHDWFHRWAKAGICERIMRKAGRCVEKRGGFKTALKLAVPRANAVGGAASGSKSSRHSPTAR